MKEIKFRAFDLVTKGIKQVEFIYLYSKEDEDGNLGEVSFEGEKTTKYFGNGSLKQVELMQYTGLKDKNGKEIYEGDIIEYLDASGFSLEDVGINCGIVELDLCEGINFTNRGSVDMEDIDFEEVEIIGNIYENTELLNK